MLKRSSWRVQPIEQIRKRKQRKREMWERHQQFVEFLFLFIFGMGIVAEETPLPKLKLRR